MYRVFKISQLPAKITTYLVSIAQLLCSAFLNGRCFLNKISLDWLLTLTSQPSTSKLSDTLIRSRDNLDRFKQMGTPSLTINLLFWFHGEKQKYLAAEYVTHKEGLLQSNFLKGVPQSVLRQ